MRSLLVEHDAIWRDVIGKRHGHSFKHTGDGVAAVFGSASDAVAAAVDAQVRLGEDLTNLNRADIRTVYADCNHACQVHARVLRVRLASDTYMKPTGQGSTATRPLGVGEPIAVGWPTAEEPLRFGPAFPRQGTRLGPGPVRLTHASRGEGV